MSAQPFKSQRASSTSVNPRTLHREDEPFSTDASSHHGSSVVVPSRVAPRPTRAASTTSATAGLSSSYNLPTRSYLHHTSHGSQEPFQYSSSGVREQTAELSSSFLSEPDISRRFSSPEKKVSKSTLRPYKDNGTIEERSEPATPEGAFQSGPSVSKLSEAVDKISPDAMAGRMAGSYRPSIRSNSFASIPEVAISEDDVERPTEISSLLPRERLPSYRKHRYQSVNEAEEQPQEGLDRWDGSGHQYPSLNGVGSKLRYVVLNPKVWNCREIVHKAVFEPAKMLPAVFLGLLLNLLDALSYGIILFPLGEEVFADLGADGVSMFYVSCIISQLVCSTGSIFKGGVGSEMIEVVPFFHKMTYMIMAKMGTGNPDALRATVITSYAMSSIITGFVFFVLGAARLGTLVNFFPHSILTGCIGGVGIFLFVTGIEVSARLDGNLEPTMSVLQKLFAADTVALWIPPLALAIILLTVKHFYDRPWLVPAYYIGITAIFYIITTAVPSITMTDLRGSGWVFEAPAAGVPFYNFYSYYKFSLVDWKAIWMTIPSQLALTFFGILHVPINVPNLAMVVQEDNVSINRELIMHGISNTLSGCVGSIQNYLVFVNSVLFMNTGGNSRLAGYMLAAATFGLWVAGPVVIGFVPVMVVGTLIYMLGIELAIEALISTYGRLHWLEYFTIVVIALVMGLYDFVVGIAIGIGLACLVYVVQTSRKTVIRSEFTGAVAESTVRRHPRHRNYLHKVGKQIRVVKLGGYLFFGSIVKVEKKVRAIIDTEAFAASPIRYLVLDFSHVTGIDFSAAEAFNRMNRILHRREVNLAMAGVLFESDVGRSLQMVGLFVEGTDEPLIPVPKVFEDLNGALEACENEMLMVLTEKQRSDSQSGGSPTIPVPGTPGTSDVSPFKYIVGSPRRDMLHQEASTTMREAAPETTKWQGVKQPLPLLMQVMQDLTDKDADFWFRAVPYFSKRVLHAGQVLYARGDRPDGFYLLQSGILRAEYFLEQGNYHEHIVAGTTCGELPFFSDTVRTSTVTAEHDGVAWLLTAAQWELLQNADGEVARELLKVGMKLSAERMNAITSYVLITAS